MFKLIDLTHSIHEQVPYWTGNPCFKQAIVFDKGSEAPIRAVAMVPQT